MIAARRTRWSHGLDHAIARAREHGVGLVVLEPLRVGYRWASVRHHRFVIDGMADNRAAFEATPVCYLPYVEPEAGAGSGLLEALAARACCVVTDWYPAFFLPRMVEAAAARLPVRLEAVDGNGLLPMALAGKAFARAHDFRRFLQRELPDRLDDHPVAEPLGALDLPRPRLPDGVLDRWPMRTAAELERPGSWMAGLPVDQGVLAAPLRGGSSAAASTLERFLADRLPRYADRNHPDEDAASGLSPWLHFGHVSAVEVAHRVLEEDQWTPERLAPKPTGSRDGWWGASPEVESFLDELVTWREVGYGFSAHRPDDHDRYDGLPDWAKQTLAEHAGDPRPKRYELEQLDRGTTGDALWNAAQRQLREEGRMHNYLRMLWGKKVLEWSPSPEVAFSRLVELNNRYALDGRDPNSYSGIAWCLGRFDRAWGPERPIFGKVRYMTSASTLRKLRLTRYLERWGPRGPGVGGEIGD